MRYILIIVFSFCTLSLSAQIEKKEVRQGNRNFRKGNYTEAQIDYMKALMKDSISLAANYNLASVFYKQGDYQQAQQTLGKIEEAASISEYGGDYYFNLGDVALAQKDYQSAVEAFKQSLLRNPADLEAKENYIYAKKMLENQQNQDQNQDDNQDQDNQQDQQDKDNQNDNQEDKKDNEDKQDNKDQQDNQDQNQDNKQDKRDQPQASPKVSPQQAQQMLQAIQAKEKETKDKVDKAKAIELRSKQKEKNW